MSEAFYDEHIAPKLMEVAKLCEEQGIPMQAFVWYDEENLGATRVGPSEPNPSYTLVNAASISKGNIDLMCIGLARRVKEENDSSIALRFFRKETYAAAEGAK